MRSVLGCLLEKEEALVLPSLLPSSLGGQSLTWVPDWEGEINCPRCYREETERSVMKSIRLGNHGRIMLAFK
jgi:hypothetical protein